MEIKRLSNEVLECILPEDKFTILWVSDLHKDSEFSEWLKVKKYLDENPSSYLIIGGDSLDVMQFVNDKRGSKSSTTPEYQSSDYANKVISLTRKDIIEPYKNRIISWNRGNHDNSIIRHHNIDLLGLICQTDVHIHEFSGYIILSIPNPAKGRHSSYVIHFSHAPFSGGIRSKGSLSIDIAKANYPSADMWITEHIHDGFIHPVRHEFYNRHSKTVIHQNKWYIQNIAAKQEQQGLRNGFHFETMKGNRTSGCLELHFKKDKSNCNLICPRVNYIIF